MFDPVSNPLKIKYPRTPHLPWSPGAGSDDVYCADLSVFEGREVVVTQKMDGENTSLYRHALHARSLDTRPHPSRDWIKRFHGSFAHEIPQGWRLCGENMYAVHSLHYTNLESYFYLFSVWDEHNRCQSWKDTLEWAALLELATPQVFYQGIWDEALIRKISFDPEQVEGYVVRLSAAFEYLEFGKSLAKWVRPNHVQTDQHWLDKAVVPNGLQADLPTDLRINLGHDLL